jgi:pimeloyl-ACP methyl ester carboxylesterase
MPKVRVNGIELCYEVHGQSYPAVFLHGFAVTVNVWQSRVPVLSREY